MKTDTPEGTNELNDIEPALQEALNLFDTTYWFLRGSSGCRGAGRCTPPADSKQETQKAAPEPVVEDTERGDVTVEFKEARLTSGGTITLKFKYSNNGSEPIDISRAGKYDHDDVIEHVYFVDTANNKKYLVVKDNEGKPLGTNLKYFVLGAGESKNAWAKFPAPPEGVETITLYLPGAPPIEDVTIIK